MVPASSHRPHRRATSLTIGTSQPHSLATSYSRLLSLPVTADDPPVPEDPDRGGWAQVRPDRYENGPTLNLEYERHFTRPTWPGTADGQNATMHLDIAVDDLDAAVAWAVDAGATLAKTQPQDTYVCCSTPTVTPSVCSKHRTSSALNQRHDWLAAAHRTRVLADRLSGTHTFEEEVTAGEVYCCGHRILLREVVIDAPTSNFVATRDYWASALLAEAEHVVEFPEFTAFRESAALSWVGLQEIGGTEGRYHLDIETDDVDAEVARLTSLGAVKVADGRTWVTMRDPSGHLFDVVPHESP